VEGEAPAQDASSGPCVRFGVSRARCSFAARVDFIASLALGDSFVCPACFWWKPPEVVSTTPRGSAQTRLNLRQESGPMTATGDAVEQPEAVRGKLRDACV
jgi:hypothetical protein